MKTYMAKRGNDELFNDWGLVIGYLYGKIMFLPYFIHRNQFQLE